MHRAHIGCKAPSLVIGITASFIAIPTLICVTARTEAASERQAAKPHSTHRPGRVLSYRPPHRAHRYPHRAGGLLYVDRRVDLDEAETLIEPDHACVTEEHREVQTNALRMVNRRPDDHARQTLSPKRSSDDHIANRA